MRHWRTRCADSVDTMLSFTVKKGALKRAEKPVPRQRPRWALVRVRLAGICNTDVEILRGYHGFRGTPGHEFVGEVVEVAGVSAAERKKWVGKRVCGEINIGCAALGFQPVCKFCRRGLKRHCLRRKVLGIVGQDGAFAEYLTLPVENLRGIPATIPDEAAVFVEPLAAACEILEQIDVGKFREAAVLGDGKLGQLIARVLRTRISRVVMYGKSPRKLALAGGQGARLRRRPLQGKSAAIETKRVRGDASDLKRVKETYELVVEATGSPTGLALAQQVTEARGTLVLKSTFHGAAPVETWPIVVKEITVVGSRCGRFEQAIALLRAGTVDPRALITQVFSLGEAEKAIEFAQRRGVMKVVLRCC